MQYIKVLSLPKFLGIAYKINEDGDFIKRVYTETNKDKTVTTITQEEYDKFEGAYYTCTDTLEVETFLTTYKFQYTLNELFGTLVCNYNVKKYISWWSTVRSNILVFGHPLLTAVSFISLLTSIYTRCRPSPPRSPRGVVPLDLTCE